MKVELKTLPKSEVELTITVPYEVYQKWEKKALEDISHKVTVEGFRAGHIPEDVLRRNVKEEAIKAAVLDYVLPQTYAEAVQKNEIQVIAQPKIDIKSDIKKEGDDFVYTALVAVMPEVKVGNYKKIKVKRKPVKVDPESVEKTINMIMERFAQWKDADRKAKKDDRAEVNFEGFDEEGKPIPNTSSKNHPVVLGSNTMVPGFEDAIIGMSKDESKEFEIPFPKDYHAKAMQGKKVKFKITLNRLEEKLEQKLDAAMVEKITGGKQSVEEFRKRVEDDLKKEMEGRGKLEHDNAVVSEIIKITKADLPDILVDQEIEFMLEDQKHRIKHQGLEWEQYLEHIKKTEDDFKEDHRKTAEERVLARLGSQQIIKDAKLEVEDQEVQDKISEMESNYPKEEQQKLRDHYLKTAEAYRQLKYSMTADKLIEMLTK